MSDVLPVSKLELNNRRHSEGDTPLRTGRSTSELAGTGTTIDDLPDELMLEIFSYFSFSENVDVLQEVCPRWKILAQDAHLWVDKKYVVGYLGLTVFGLCQIEEGWRLQSSYTHRIQVFRGFSNLFQVVATVRPHPTTCCILAILYLLCRPGNSHTLTDPPTYLVESADELAGDIAVLRVLQTVQLPPGSSMSDCKDLSSRANTGTATSNQESELSIHIKAIERDS
ncbi:uncharacterized protein LOC126293259 [Schistocerca gregaria]|uniref:uncharacterized protein LOC126293259 n=1 Tax=Schistocerca gregaria TaxID=7010 RepID=UPI00211EC3DC|nr:uncharacterized protein LOC126293259 [Schistocerca gregaria]